MNRHDETAIANALDRLGLNGAATGMGAIEALAKELKEGTERIADELSLMATAFDRIADALERNEARAAASNPPKTVRNPVPRRTKRED